MPLSIGVGVGVGKGMAAAAVASYVSPYPQGSLAFAYGFRQIVSGYVGPCVDVVRISDSATATFNILADGTFDVATARTFQGSNIVIDLPTGSSLKVSKWYDQTANGNHLVQGTDANRPLLLLGMFNTLPALVFNSTKIFNCPNNSAFDLTGDQTIAIVHSHLGLDEYQAGTLDATNVGWLVAGQASGKFAYYSKTKAAFSPATTTTNDLYHRSNIVTRTAGAVAIYLEGVADGTDTGHGNAASGAQFSVGGYSQGGTKKAVGATAELVGYSAALAIGDITTLAANHAAVFKTKNRVLNPPPFVGAHALRFVPSSYIDAGSVLAYEYTQPWSMTAAIRMNARPSPSSGLFNYAMIMGNCGNGGPGFPGYETWVDSSGFLRVRLINTFSTKVMIGRLGSISLCDDVWHVIYTTYDGSGLASGVKMYIDGVQDLNTRIEYDALTAHTIVSAQTMLVGNQSDNIVAGYFTGSLDYVQLHNVERSAAYVAAHSTAGTLTAANDANVVLSYAMDEGSGTSVTDGSASGFTGTITGSPVWLS